MLLVLAEELGGFIELVGGASAASCLLPALGQLATVEETVVRNKVRGCERRRQRRPLAGRLRTHGGQSICARRVVAGGASRRVYSRAPPPLLPSTQAVESACLVIAGLDNATVVEHVLPVIQKLTQDSWFTARVSACGLFAAAYARLSDEPSKTTLRSCVCAGRGRGKGGGEGRRRASDAPAPPPPSPRAPPPPARAATSSSSARTRRRW